MHQYSIHKLPVWGYTFRCRRHHLIAMFTMRIKHEHTHILHCIYTESEYLRSSDVQRGWCHASAQANRKLASDKCTMIIATVHALRMIWFTLVNRIFFYLHCSSSTSNNQIHNNTATGTSLSPSRLPARQNYMSDLNSPLIQVRVESRYNYIFRVNLRWRFALRLAVVECCGRWMLRRHTRPHIIFVRTSFVFGFGGRNASARRLRPLDGFYSFVLCRLI